MTQKARATSQAPRKLYTIQRLQPPPVGSSPSRLDGKAAAMLPTPAGLAVGFIVRRPNDQADIDRDSAGEAMFDVWSYDHHATLDDARRDLARARAEYPGDDWRIYALTDITERPTS